jgi:hypothetical protein
LPAIVPGCCLLGQRAPGKRLDTVEDESSNGRFLGGHTEGDGSAFSDADNPDARVRLGGPGGGGADGCTQVGHVRFCHLEGTIPAALGFLSAMTAIVKSEHVEPVGTQMFEVGQSVPAVAVQLVTVDDGATALLGQAVEEGAAECGPVVCLEAEFLPFLDRLAPMRGEPGPALARLVGHGNAQNTSHRVQDEGEQEENKKQPEDATHGDPVAERK